MTDREKAIVMAHTGICMLSGDKFQVFHKYIEDIMGRPILTHELGIESIVDEIIEKSKGDFKALCADEIRSESPIKWIPVSKKLPDIHNYSKPYLVTTKDGKIRIEMFYETNGKSWWSIADDYVVAWQPLPQPYNGESEE